MWNKRRANARRWKRKGKGKRIKQQIGDFINILSDFHAHFILFKQFLSRSPVCTLKRTTFHCCCCWDVQPVARICGYIFIYIWKILVKSFALSHFGARWWIYRSNKKHKLQLTGDHISLCVTILHVWTDLCLCLVCVLLLFFFFQMLILSWFCSFQLLLRNRVHTNKLPIQLSIRISPCWFDFILFIWWLLLTMKPC